MDHVKLRYMLEQPILSWGPYLTHLGQRVGVRKNLQARVNQQETRNFFSSKQKSIPCFSQNKESLGSSETIREAHSLARPDFSAFKKSLPEHKAQKIDDSFLYWFIGFIEGDGSFITSERKKRIPDSPKAEPDPDADAQHAHKDKDQEQRKAVKKAEVKSLIADATHKQTNNNSAIVKWSFNPSSYRADFQIVQKNPQVLYYLKKQLGFGRVVSFERDYNSLKGGLMHMTKKKYWKWFTSKREHIKSLILLMNGNLVLEKRRKLFENWLTVINKSWYADSPIPLKPWVNNVSLENDWLAGFTDADVGFTTNAGNNFKQGHHPDGRQRYGFNLRFYITQDGELEVLNQIKKLVGATNKISDLRNATALQKKYNRLEIAKASCREILIQYFSTHPLRTQKNIDFQRWKRVHYYQQRQLPLSKKSAAKLARLINHLDEKRIKQGRKYHLQLKPRCGFLPVGPGIAKSKCFAFQVIYSLRLFSHIKIKRRNNPKGLLAFARRVFKGLLNKKVKTLRALCFFLLFPPSAGEKRSQIPFPYALSICFIHMLYPYALSICFIHMLYPYALSICSSLRAFARKTGNDPYAYPYGICIWGTLRFYLSFILRISKGICIS
uniref:Putative LAGLIDADG homing endonuclease n=1 Tax=Staurocarteria crucifera TaxID=47781 RepID=A0A0S2IBT7_9CHLO|nr:putative LAGLIDADG homing endonuclease [Carteria crucifera]